MSSQQLQRQYLQSIGFYDGGNATCKTIWRLLLVLQATCSFLATLLFFSALFYIVHMDECWCKDNRELLFQIGCVVKAFCMVPFVIFEYYLILCEHLFVDASHYMSSMNAQNIFLDVQPSPRSLNKRRLVNKGGQESPKGFKAPGSGRAGGQPGDGGGALPGERTTSINHRPHDDGPLVEALLLSPTSHAMASLPQSGLSQGRRASHTIGAGPLETRAR